MSQDDLEFDTVIIGSGMGGMTAARLLQEMRGDRVLLLERHTAIGGMTHEFVRRTELADFVFSTGLHYLGDEQSPTAPRTLISFLTGGSMQWARLPEHYDVYRTPKRRFAVPSSFKAMVEYLGTQFPKERTAIRRYFFKDIPRASKQLILLNVANSLPPKLRRLILPAVKRVSRLALRTTHDVIDTRFLDPNLKSILGFQWGDYGRSPRFTAFGIHARIIGHYSHGAIYPVGGSMRIARKTADLIERNNGEVWVGTEVRSVIVERGRATGVLVRDRSSGVERTVRCGSVVSSAGALNTYARLLPEEYGSQGAEELADLGTTISAVVLFIGFKSSPETLSFDGANHWVFSNDDHELSSRAKPGEGPLYFSLASLKNPAARSHVAEIVSLCDGSYFADWEGLSPPHDDADYQAYKEAIKRRILERADEFYPGFVELVAYAELATPLTFKTYQNSVDGAFYGLPASPRRLLSPFATARTPVKGLYLAGQDALIPGIIGAAAGGARCVAIMLGGDKTRTVFKTIVRKSKEVPAGPWNGFLRIGRIVKESPTVRSFYLHTLDGSQLPMSWKAGQYLNLFVPTDTNKTIRSYSISSASGQQGAGDLRLTVKREPDGKGSSFLHDSMAEGDLIEVAGPHGSFTFETGDAERIALIGGGVGVTPLVSVLEHIRATEPDLHVLVVFAFRSREEILFYERLSELKMEMPNLAVHVVVSDSGDPDWHGPTGRIDKAFLSQVCHDIETFRVHLCGPIPMMEALTVALGEMGVTASELRTESFGASSAKPRSDKGKPFTLTFKRLGRTVQGRVGDTILDVAMREKVDIPYSCGVGSCGACRMKITKGRYESPPTDMLSKRETDQGYVLACKTRPQTDLSIDV